MASLLKVDKIQSSAGLTADVNDIATKSVTGSASFSNSTQNISLSGIGVMYGLEVGDVIQVSGSNSNDTEYTVEIITDSNNIVVNYEHRGGTTSKALTDEATAGVTVKLLCKWYQAETGLGQGWCTPASDRSDNTLYYPPTNRAIEVAIRYGGDFNQYLYVDGQDIAWSQSSITTYDPALKGKVPRGNSYEYSGSVNLKQSWKELR